MENKKIILFLKKAGRESGLTVGIRFDIFLHFLLTEED